MTPPPGTVASVPPWFISELAGFLKRGGERTATATEEEEEESAVRDQVLSLLNPGYGGRASPSKGQFTAVTRDGLIKQRQIASVAPG